MRFSLYPSRSQVVGCGIAALMAASFLSVASAQVTLLNDTFDGSSLNTGLWANGSTGSLGITTVSGGSVSLDVNREDAARNGLLAHGTNFNPFEAPITITLNGLSLGGTANGNPIALYGAVGRLPTDLGGVATGALASTYSAGGGGYYSGGGTGGVLGFSILKNSSGAHLLQVLDVGGINGTGAVTNVFGNVGLSGMPTDMAWVIDGANAQFTITLEGATFTAGPGSGTNTVTGSIVNFSEAVLDTGSGIVSRFVIGANNTGASITDGAIAGFGEVTVVSAIPEPSTYALIASAFICGVVVLRRRTRA